MLQIDFFSEEFFIGDGIWISSHVQAYEFLDLKVERLVNIDMNDEFLAFSVKFYKFRTDVGDQIFANSILHAHCV